LVGPRWGGELVLVLVQEREELIGSPCAGISANGDLSQDAAFLERVERQAYRFSGAADRCLRAGDVAGDRSLVSPPSRVASALAVANLTAARRSASPTALSGG
jgi:hypothetical protein